MTEYSGLLRKFWDAHMTYATSPSGSAKEAAELQMQDLFAKMKEFFESGGQLDSDDHEFLKEVKFADRIASGGGPGAPSS